MTGPGPAGPNNKLTELVEQAVAGKPVALEKLLLHFHERLAARVDRRLPQDVRAVCAPEDILQETYSEAFRDIGNFRPRTGQEADESFFRWLGVIADHRVVDAVRALRAAKRGGGAGGAAGGTDGHARHAGRVVEARVPIGQSSIAPLIEVLAIDSHTPSRDARGHELQAAIHAAIQTLYPAYREALELRYLKGLSPAEVAQRMGRSEEAVHKLCGRALGALREAMGDAARFLGRE